LFKGGLPKRPYCTSDPTKGLIIRSVEQALRFRYIQPNHPNSKLNFVFDIDRPTCVSEITDDLNLPAPHYFVQNPKNHHAHVFYCLDTPVHLNHNSSQKAMRFGAAVDCSMTDHLSADSNYSGLIAKNPVHEHWRTYTINSDGYDLTEIAEYLNLDTYSDQRRSMPDTGLGRNVNLFDRVRKWAYKAKRRDNIPDWHGAVLEKAEHYNTTENPLQWREVRQIAKSVAKWTDKHFSQEAFSATQASRGRRKGKKRRDDLLPKALEMRAQGATQQAIAEALDVSQPTIVRWLSFAHYSKPYQIVAP